MVSSRQILLCATLLVTGGGIGWAGNRHLRQPQAVENALPAVYPAPIAAQPSLPVSANFIAKAVQRVGPAVVRIDASHHLSSLGSDDPVLRRFFGEGRQPERPAQRAD